MSWYGSCYFLMMCMCVYVFTLVFCLNQRAGLATGGGYTLVGCRWVLDRLLLCLLVIRLHQLFN